MRNIQFNSDGTILYLWWKVAVMILTNIHCHHCMGYTALNYSCNHVIQLVSQTETMRGFIFTANFTKLYVTGDNGAVHRIQIL